MKTTIRTSIGGLALLSALVFTLHPSSARAQGTAFTYQGRLDAWSTGCRDLPFKQPLVEGAVRLGIDQGRFR